MRLLLCLLLSLFTLDQTSAQSEMPSETPPPSSSVGDDFGLYLKLTGRTFTSPLRWNGSDWLTAGGVAAATGASSLLDDEMFSLMRRNQSTYNNRLSDAVVKYGAGVTGAALTGGLYVVGLASDNTWLRETSVMMASALTVSFASEFALKLVVGRARPYTDLGNTTFKPFNGTARYFSFPSGHTVVAFTLSTVLSERINNTWASVGLYALATVTAGSRMYTRDHWVSDIVFAGALSTFVAHSVVHSYESGIDDDHATGFRIVPQTNGVMVVWRF